MSDNIKGNKNTGLRYQIYDRMFSDPTKPIGYCWHEIELELGDSVVSQQQFLKDIRIMTTLCFHDDESVIKKTQSGKNVYYKYKDDSISFDHDQKTLNAIKTLSEIQGLGFDHIIENLCDMTGVTSSQKIISLDCCMQYEGLDYLRLLYEYIVSKSVLEIKYKAAYKDSLTCVIHPYHLRRYNSRWFLFGWCVSAVPMPENVALPHLFNIPLDRIEEINEIAEDYQEMADNGISFEGEDDYFYDVVGVTIPTDENTKKPKDVIDIRFKVSEHRCPYVKTKSLHPSQTSIHGEERTFEISVIPNRELDSLILSYGKDIEILSPPEYREHIKEIIKEQYSLYH